MPSLADLALRAGDFLAVVVDAEVVAGVALLGAVLAGAVARQRPAAAICGRVFAALTDTGGAVAWCRRGLLRRVASARVACAASLPRWIYFITIHDATWDAAAASGASGQPEAA